MNYNTREEWLTALVEKLAPLFVAQNYELPAIRVSCSWPSRLPRKRIGECWQARASKDGSSQIFISPTLDDGVRVADVMVHELLHAVLPDDVRHKGPFRQGMKALGLEGKPTATTAGPELKERLNIICSDLGKYPHAALSLDLQMKKQTTRLVKLECPGCGYIIRTTRTWIDDAGVPTCPCGSKFQEE